MIKKKKNKKNKDINKVALFLVVVVFSFLVGVYKDQLVARISLLPPFSYIAGTSADNISAFQLQNSLKDKVFVLINCTHSLRGRN